MEITAAVARTPAGNFSVEPVNLAEPQDDEVLVRIVGVGLCHTDLIARDQFIPIPLLAVFGHEGAGIVERVGRAVRKVKPGDCVVLSFSSCGQCDRCGEGLPCYCRTFPQRNYSGTRPDGTATLSAGTDRISGNFFGQSSFGTYALTRERNLVIVDASAPLEILGPLGCGIQTGAGGIMRSLACEAGSSVVIFGGGAVGLSALLGTVVQGCGRVVVVEPHVSRRRLAQELGATDTIDPRAGDVKEAIRTLLPSGADYSFETSGVVAMIETAVACLGSHGVCGLVGVPPTPDSALNVNIAGLITYGHCVKGIVEGDSDPDVFIPELIALHRQGRFPFDKFVTTFPLERINEALDAQHRGECVKVVLLL